MSSPRLIASGAAMRVWVILAAALLLAVLALPIASLVLRVPGRELLSRMSDPMVLGALRLSLLTSLSATAAVVLLGLPVAYLLARREFPGKRVVEAVVELPMVLPPTVAGIALLLAFGRAGLAGRALQLLGLSLPFSTLGVVVAQVFMAAPFFVAPARAGLAAVDPRYLDAAATLRASEAYCFFRVMVPLSLPSLLAGTAMSCARALGEFGATITFAGNMPGVTQTMPLAVYAALQTDLEAAVTLSVILLVFSFTLLLGLRFAPVGLFWRRPDAARRVR